MKQTTDDQNTITRVVVREVVRGELKHYPTKFDLESALENQDERARQYRDEILTKMDQVMGELAQLREDRVFEEHDVKILKATTDNHERRIKKLETKQD